MAQKYGKGLDHATGSNFGRLAGFLNQEPELKTARGHNPRVLCIESTGQEASQGQFLIDQLIQTMMKNNAEKESKRRSNQAIEAHEDRLGDKLVHTYQKHFKSLSEGLNRQIDQQTLDAMICIKMAKAKFKPQEIVETLQKASPEVPLRQIVGDTQYSRDLVNSVFKNPEIQKEISKSRSYSKGFSR